MLRYRNIILTFIVEISFFLSFFYRVYHFDNSWDEDKVSREIFAERCNKRLNDSSSRNRIGIQRSRGSQKRLKIARLFDFELLSMIGTGKIWPIDCGKILETR